MRNDRRLIRMTAAFAAGALCGGIAFSLSRLQSQPISGVGNVASPASPADSTLLPAPETPPEDFYQSFAEARREQEEGGSPDFANLARRWAAQSPGEAFLAYLQLPNGGGCLDQIIAIWAQKDFPASLEAAGSMNDVALRNEMIRTALSSAAEKDPAGTVAALEADPRRCRPDLCGEVFARWAAKDPAGAKRAVASLRNPALRIEAAKNVAAGLAQEDPSGAFRWAAALENKYHREEALARSVEIAIRSDLAVAAEGLLLMTDGERKEDLASVLIHWWSDIDSEAAVDWIRENLRGPIRDSAWRNLIGQIQDREAALALIEEIPRGEDRRRAINDIFRSWQAGDPDEAVSLLERFDKEEAVEARTSLVEAWAYRNPAEAARYAGELPRGEISASAVGTAVGQWSELDPESAVSWAASLQGEGGSQVLGAAIAGWGRIDPDAASEYVAGLTDPALREQCYEGIFNSYAAWNPAGAAEWMEDTVADPEARIGFYGELAFQWVQSDNAAASRWIESLPPGAERDSAVTGLLRGVGSLNLQTAAHWVETISDASQRNAWIEKLEENQTGDKTN